MWASYAVFLDFAFTIVGFFKFFVDKAQPLKILLKKGTSFEWTKEYQSSWKTLKQTLFTAPILSYPCPDSEFTTDTDNSSFGPVAVFLLVQSGKERVIGY